jgi:hypothetical protein
MPNEITFHGSRAELQRLIARVPGILSGKEADPGITTALLTRMGLSLLSHVKQDFEVKSAGGHGQVGGTWPPLSPTTLALRRKVSTPKAVKKLEAQLPNLPAHRQRLIQIHFERLQSVYLADAMSSREGLKARIYARRLLHLITPYISKTRAKTLDRELKEQESLRAYRLGLSGAFALILRDSGRLLSSLSPEIQSQDRVLRVLPGQVKIGSNVRYFPFHDSDKPRKKKRDGTDKLPRRQILPDEKSPIPRGWWADISASLSAGLSEEAVWQKILGS